MSSITEIITMYNNFINEVVNNTFVIYLIIIPMLMFIIIFILGYIAIVNSKINELKETTEEDEYYKTIIEYGNTTDEIKNIKTFNNEK